MATGDRVSNRIGLTRRRWTEPHILLEKAEEEQLKAGSGEFNEELYLTSDQSSDQSRIKRHEGVGLKKEDSPTAYRERAPYDRRMSLGALPTAEFDEKSYLGGKIPVKLSGNRESFSDFTKIPSRKFKLLYRSVSQDDSAMLETLEVQTPVTNGTPAEDLVDEIKNKDMVYDKMVYCGRNIPSRTFMRLQQSIMTLERRRLKSSSPPFQTIPELKQEQSY